MRASPTILRTAVMRRWSSEAGSLEGVWRGTWGVAVHTLHRVRNNQIRRLDRQVAVAEVGGQQELEELVWSPGGRGAAVEAGLVAPQRLVQQTHKLALALAQTAPQVAECLQRLPLGRGLSPAQPVPLMVGAQAATRSAGLEEPGLQPK